MQGLGQVRLGMTLREASRAVGAKLAISPDYDYPRECSYAFRVDGRENNIAYMFHRDRIVRIDIDHPQEGKHWSDVRTEAGVGLNSSAEAVRKAYGEKIVIKPHPYGDENDHYFLIDNKSHKVSFLFEIESGKVSTFRVGTHPAVDYIEGCE